MAHTCGSVVDVGRQTSGLLYVNSGPFNGNAKHNNIKWLELKIGAQLIIIISSHLEETNRDSQGPQPKHRDREAKRDT